MRRTKANRALTFVMAAALLIGSIHGVGAKEQSKDYDAPELTLVQGASDYDLTAGITYDSEKYILSVTDTGNFDINVVIYALSDFLIMILSWLVKQSLRAFLFQEVQP